jgi:hypothetical protein
MIIDNCESDESYWSPHLPEIPICTNCRHEERQWQGVNIYPSLCRATIKVHPVTGRQSADNCMDTNGNGECENFVQKNEMSKTGCLIYFFIVAAALILLSIMFQNAT